MSKLHVLELDSEEVRETPDHSLLGTIHILRKHIFRIFGPPSLPYVSIILVLRISKNWAFMPPPPPTSAYVLYEWSLIHLSCLRVCTSILLHRYFDNNGVKQN